MASQADTEFPQVFLSSPASGKLLDLHQLQKIKLEDDEFLALVRHEAWLGKKGFSGTGCLLIIVMPHLSHGGG